MEPAEDFEFGPSPLPFSEGAPGSNEPKPRHWCVRLVAHHVLEVMQERRGLVEAPRPVDHADRLLEVASGEQRGGEREPNGQAMGREREPPR